VTFTNNKGYFALRVSPETNAPLVSVRGVGSGASRAPLHVDSAILTLNTEAIKDLHLRYLAQVKKAVPDSY
jgi:hypothetical protein